MLTAKATCPDADQALDPLRDVGTGNLIDALRTTGLALHTRQDAVGEVEMRDFAARVKGRDFVRAMNVVHFY